MLAFSAGYFHPQIQNHALSYKVKKNVQSTFSACGGSLLRHDSIPPQCDPQRSVFFSIGIGTFQHYHNTVFPIENKKRTIHLLRDG